MQCLTQSTHAVHTALGLLGQALDSLQGGSKVLPDFPGELQHFKKKTKIIVICALCPVPYKGGGGRVAPGIFLHLVYSPQWPEN